jgi:hypothetical protein
MSANPLYFAPMRVPLVDPQTGIITREWYFLFQGMFRRTDTSQDEQLSPISSPGADEALAAVAALQDVSPAPAVFVVADEQLIEQLAQVRELVADLITQIQAIRQGTTL